MRRLVTAALVAVLPFSINPSAQAQSQNPSTTAPSSLSAADPALGKLLDAYATIAGGWYLERRCDHLSQELKAEFDWNVAQTNIALSRRADPKFLGALQQSGLKVAETKTCGKETRELVTITLAMSRDTTKLLTGQTYSPTADLAYKAQRITALLAAQRIDDTCKVMPADARKEFDSRLVTITKDFAQAAGVAALDKVKAASSDLFQKFDGKCNEKVGVALRNNFNEARLQSPAWKAN